MSCDFFMTFYNEYEIVPSKSNKQKKSRKKSCFAWRLKVTEEKRGIRIHLSEGRICTKKSRIRNTDL